MRHGKHLGFSEPFMAQLVPVLDREMGDAYPEVRRNREMIEKTILAEEHRFDAVADRRLPRLEAEIAKALETPQRLLSGESAVPSLRHVWRAIRVSSRTPRPRRT